MFTWKVMYLWSDDVKWATELLLGNHDLWSWKYLWSSEWEGWADAGAGEFMRPKGAATADVQNQRCLPFHHFDLGIVCPTTEKSWFGVSGITEGFWKVKKWMRVIKDRAKYSSGEAAGITSRLMLADTFGKPVSYKKSSSKRSSAKFCLVSGQERSFRVCGLHFQTIYIALSRIMSCL